MHKHNTLIERKFKWVKYISLSWVLLCVIFMIAIFKKNNYEVSSFDLDKYGQELKDARKFTIYQGNVYVTVVGSGDVRVEEADASSLRGLSSNIAADNQHVFCANQIMPHLDATKTKHIGGTYVSDGIHTYYCAGQTIDNPNLSGLDFVIQTLLYNFNFAKKPLRDIYEFAELPESSEPYTVKFFDIATDGKLVYFQGHLMPQANPKIITPVPNYIGNSKDSRPSSRYFMDGKNVYYLSHQLTNINHSDVEEYEFDYHNGSFLHDKRHQQYYYKDQPFTAGLQPIVILRGTTDYGVFPVLFLSNKGIYFIRRDNHNLHRAGDNPFVGQITEIADSIFIDDYGTYLVNGKEHRRRSKNGNHLCGRVTQIFKIENIDPTQWRSLNTFEVNSQIWKNGDRYFYFDLNGRHGFESNVIYEIRSPQLLEKEIKPKDLEGLLENGDLTFPQVSLVLEADDKIGDCLF